MILGEIGADKSWFGPLTSVNTNTPKISNRMPARRPTASSASD
jgi:hypothetical protein